MAYLARDFKTDAFVSYSHGDPKGLGDAPLKQWTLALIQKLEKEIRSLYPDFAEIELWRDEQHDPTAKLTEALRDRVKHSCILIIVMSSYYLGSAWCKDELEWFRDQIKERTELDQGRVFIIRAQPTDASKWPDFLRDERGHALLGFQFCAADAEMPYGWPDLVIQKEEFRQALNTLLTALIKRLHEFKKKYSERAADAAPVSFMSASAGAISRRLYLHAAPAQIEARDAVQRALEQDGLHPVSTRLAAPSAADFGQEERRSRLNQAKRCDALVFVTGTGGAADEDEFFQVCVDDRRVMEGERGAPLPCVVLDRSGGRLSFSPAAWDAACIDATREGWRDELLAWADRAAPGRAS